MSNQCPQCGTPRLGESPFCQTCGFDFQNPGRPPVAEICPRCSAPLQPGFSQCRNCGFDWRDPAGESGAWASSMATLAIFLGISLIVILVGSIAFVTAAIQRQGVGAWQLPSQITYPTSNPNPTPKATEPPTAPPVSTPTPTAVPQASIVRWVVGLGGGALPNQIAAEQSFVANYNATNVDGITLQLEVLPNPVSADALNVLKTEIAAGSVDIVGPVGTAARDGFEGAFMDLSSELRRHDQPLSTYDPALVDYLRSGDGLIGLPYEIYPGYIWYNKDLFTKAGLPALPTKVGEKYQGQTWDWTELGKVAAKLTLDTTGKNSTQTGFNKASIKQYGMDFQWADARRMASCFGGGSLVAADGVTAQIPAVWSDAYSWYYDAIWKNHIAPDSAVEKSTLFNSGAQASGLVAMSAAWGWSISSIAESAATSRVKHWDIAVMPSWKGATSSPLDMDTFAITKASLNPDAAFIAMQAIEADPVLMRDYGGEPAMTAYQAGYFAEQSNVLAPVFPGNKVTWSVLGEMEKHPSVPSQDSNLPNLAQSQTDIGAFYTNLQSKPGLNIATELTKLKATLQADFNKAQPPT